jgi:hypothetical protein
MALKICILQALGLTGRIPLNESAILLKLESLREAGAAPSVLAQRVLLVGHVKFPHLSKTSTSINVFIRNKLMTAYFQILEVRVSQQFDISGSNETVSSWVLGIIPICLHVLRHIERNQVGWAAFGTEFPR